MVQGCLAWQRLGGLHPPQSVMDATAEYFDGEDSVGQWIEARCVLHGTLTSLSAALYADWKTWTERAGEHTGSIKRFSEALISRRFERWRNGKGLMGFRGIGLSPSADQPYGNA